MKTTAKRYKYLDPKKILSPSNFGNGSMLKIAKDEAMNIAFVKKNEDNGSSILNIVSKITSVKGPIRPILPISNSLMFDHFLPVLVVLLIFKSKELKIGSKNFPFEIRVMIMVVKGPKYFVISVLEFM